MAYHEAFVREARHSSVRTFDIGPLRQRSVVYAPARRRIIALILSSLVCAPSNSSMVPAPSRRSQEADNEQAVQVPASDVGHRIVIVGRLGFPLGTLVTIQGRWERFEPAKEVSRISPLLTFVAKEVNGRELTQSVRFESDFVSPLLGGAFKDPPRNVGDIWEVRALEAGRFIGVPDEARRELVSGPQTEPPRAQPGFGFHTEIKYLRLKLFSARTQRRLRQ